MNGRVQTRRSTRRQFFSLFMAVLLAVGMGFGLEASAAPFAPLADYAAVDMHRNPVAQWLAKATPPEAAEVGVAPSPGARIVYVGGNARVVGDQYQDIRVIRLYTVDPMNQVADYYKAHEAGWVWNDRSGSMGMGYPGQGSSAQQDLLGSRKALLSGPRILLSDIDRADHPLRAEIELMLQMAPGSRTEIKIEYPGETYDNLPVTPGMIAAATQRCVADETARLVETAASKFPSSMPQEQRARVLAMQASNTCKGIERDCTKGPNQVRCQQKLRRYGP